MSLFTELKERLVALVLRGREDRELAEELRFHLEMEEEANVRRGFDREEARRQAAISLGGLQQTSEAVRDARGIRVLEDLVRDTRYAFRSLARAPGLTVTVTLVLALGIGGTIAIFSAVRAVMLRPLPFSEPDRLYMLWQSNPEMGGSRQPVSPANYLDWKDRLGSFSDVEAYGDAPARVPITGLGDPIVLNRVAVTGGFFSMVGVRPMLGRDFTEQETWAEGTWRAGEFPLLLSARAWRTVFGGEESVVGRLVEYNGGRARIVGVMPDGFAFPSEEVDLWAPFGWPSEAREAEWFRRAHSIRPVGRLAAGATAEQARAELEAVAAQLEGEHPQVNERIGAGLSSLHAFLVGDTRTPLLILLAAVGVMLLIACANVGNLLLVRASGRRREFAVRAALGAGRGRLVRQMMTESLLLGLLGGAAGVGVGAAATRVLERLQPEGLLRVTTFPIDGGVVALTILLTAAATLFFGAFPVLFARRAGPGETLRASGRAATAGRSTMRIVGGLVVAEVALAVLLVLGAGLLVRTTVELRQVDPGFDPHGVVAISLSLPGVRYPSPPVVIAFVDELLTRVQALPDAQSVAVSSTFPLRDPGPTSDFFIAGRAPDQYGVEVLRRSVTPRYFETLGVPLVSGRPFSDADVWRGDPVALVNEAFARQYFPGLNPVGQRITTDRIPDSTSVWRTIVGVVGDERQSAIATPSQIELIEPFDQAIEREFQVYVRGAGRDPSRLLSDIRSIVRDLDPELPIVESVALEEVVADSIARDRFLMLLLSTFASVALVLALVGVYGVTAQAARQRLPEFGIRMALGARAAQILRLALRRGMVLVILGLGLGVAAALAATRVMEGLLYGVAPNDPVTFVTAASLLLAAGIAASWLPARTAARVDPASTLRAE